LESTAIPTLHFHDFREAATLHEELRLRGRRALVIGKRVSGGQLVEELVDAGYSVSVACHSPLTFSRPPWMQHAIFPFYFAVESWIAARRPIAREDSYPPMQAGRVPALIRNGKVVVRCGVVEFRRDTVQFDDGAEEPFDVVLFATGFRPALDHLRGVLDFDREGLPALQQMESTTARGLYFLGLNNQRDFRSRYLRGIREDARVLATQIQQRLTTRAAATV
jgi:putative flavoprotein involved in K+ transport